MVFYIIRFPHFYERLNDFYKKEYALVWLCMNNQSAKNWAGNNFPLWLTLTNIGTNSLLLKHMNGIHFIRCIKEVSPNKMMFINIWQIKETLTTIHENKESNQCGNKINNCSQKCGDSKWYSENSIAVPDFFLYVYKQHKLCCSSFEYESNEYNRGHS